MVAKTWLKLLRNSIGAAALLVAAQVGVGSGLGVLDWRLSFAAIEGWGQLLTWVAFIFATGVSGGAVIGRRALRRPRPTLTLWARLASAAAAALGGALAIPLVWIPIRVAQPPVDARAEVTMLLTAGIGVLVGLVLAVAALTWRAVTASVTASAAWVWLFALVSVGLAAKDHVRASPRLGMIDAPQTIGADAWWLGPYLMVGIAAVLGLAVAAVAGWKGATWFGIALCGLAGPALVASAYLITGWGVSGNGEELGPYLASLLAAAAGVLASMAVASAMIPHRPAPRPAAAPATPLATLPAPLAITSYAEPAYVLESSSVEPAYRREPGFLQTIYLPGKRVAVTSQAVRPQPASDPRRRAEPAPESTYEPPYEEPYEPPYDPKNPPRPAVKTAGHAAPVEAVVIEAPAAKAEPDVVDAVVVEPRPEPAAPRAQPGPAESGKRKGRQKDKGRRPSGRREAESEPRPLRKGERDHIDWIDNLVKLPVDPTLKMSKDR